MISDDDIKYYVKDLPRIEFEKCSCGHPSCRYYFLRGIGSFVQGSGFTRDEAVLIAGLLNREKERAN